MKNGGPGTVLDLQRTHGNRFVQRLLLADTAHGARGSPRGNSRSEARGQALEPDVRQLMETRFGEDFSRVRVHIDEHAEETAQEMGAVAYTLGSDVFFGAGQYDPRTQEGTRRLAHELAHVVQQAPAEAGRHDVGQGNLVAETEAAQAAQAVGDGVEPVRLQVRSPRSIQRQEGALLAFRADLEQRARRVQALSRTGTPTIAPFGDPKTGVLSGFQLHQDFQLDLAKEARADNYALVQWIKGELYEDRSKIWPGKPGSSLRR